MKSQIQNGHATPSAKGGSLTKSKILLHVCCGVCSLGVIEWLKSEHQDVVLFFYNPNIFPKEEYARRLAAANKVARLKKLKLMEGPSDAGNWLSAVRRLENEPEGGRRCEVCFRIRLEKSAQKAKEAGCDCFATTLTISPHKNAEIINQIGEAAARKYGIRFQAEDFKKKNGFRKAISEAKKHNLYRQNYCGCAFSLFSAA